MSESDLEAMRCTRQVIAAMQRLRVLLEQREETLRQALATPDRVIDYATALKGARITEDREELNEALFELERCRRESRVASFRSALDHGVSINELSRIWGFSRQM